MGEKFLLTQRAHDKREEKKKADFNAYMKDRAKEYRARKKAEKTNQAQTGVSTDKEDKPGRRKKKVKNDPFTSTTDHLNDISTSRTKNISNEDEGMNQLEDTTVVVPRKKAEKKKSKAKNERNVDTNNSTSSHSNVSSDSELPVADGHENSAGTTLQKKAAKKRSKAKNQHKQDTSESTTSNSNTHAEEVPDESNMDIILASYRRFNQFPCYESSSDNSDPNSIPPWFWYLFSLILLHNHSNSPTVNIYNYTDLSHRTSQRIKGKGNKNYHELSSLHAPLKLNNKIKKRIDTEVNFELSDLMDLG